METKILTDDEKGISEAAKILESGGLVAMPTETVYGLAANALDGTAVAKIFEAKGRPQDNPLIAHIDGIPMLKAITSALPEKACLAAESFWPGPFTMVLPRADIVPSVVSAGLDTLAVRMPSDAVAHRLIKKCGFPLAAPSANLSGRPSPTTADSVISDLGGRIDAVIRSHDCSVGLESTVVSFMSPTPRLLRPGAVTVEQLRRLLGDVDIDRAILEKPADDARVASPGMKYRHYSPRAAVYMIDGDDKAFTEYINSRAADGVMALCYDEQAAALKVDCVTLGPRGDEYAHAARLFNALRELDRRGCRVCYAVTPKKDNVSLAVYNRLIRAAGFNVIHL